jgi:phage-related protein
VVEARKEKATAPKRPKRQWRDYRTEAGGRPVKDFIDRLNDEAAASVAAAMREVRNEGLPAAKHVRNEVYEVIAETKDLWIRILFAQQGRYSQVLLALLAFEKKTNKTPPQEIDLAEKRLSSWKDRGRKRKAAKGAKKKT